MDVKGIYGEVKAALQRANPGKITNIFEEWVKNVKELQILVDVEGPIDLLLADLTDILPNCEISGQVIHYISAWLKFVLSVREEAWCLMNGQMVHDYQKIMRQKFAFRELVAFQTGNNLSTRHLTGGLPLQVCCYEGLMFLHEKNLRRLSETEDLRISEIRDELQVVINNCGHLVETILHGELKKIYGYSNVEVSLNYRKVSFTYNIGSRKVTCVVPINDKDIDGKFYQLLTRRIALPNPEGFSPPPDCLHSRAAIEVANAEDLEAAAAKAREHEEYLKKEKAAAKVKKASAKITSTKSGSAGKKPGYRASPPGAVCASFSSDEQQQFVSQSTGSSNVSMEEDELEANVERELFKSTSPKRSSVFLSNDQEAVSKKPKITSFFDDEASDATPKFQFKRRLATPRTIASGSSNESSPASTPRVKDPSAKAKVGAVTASIMSQADVSRNNASSSQSSSDETDHQSISSTPAKSSTSSTPKGAKVFNTRAYTVHDLKHCITDKVRINSWNVGIGSENRRPTTEEELKIWVAAEDARADVKFMNYILSFAQKTVDLQVGLEDHVIDYVLKKREIYQCGPNELLVVDNWSEIIGHAKTKSYQAMDELIELEKSDLTKEATRRIEQYKIDLLSAQAGDVDRKVLREENAKKISEFSKETTLWLNEGIAIIVNRLKSMKARLGTVINHVTTKVSYLWAKINNCLDEVPSYLIENYQKLCRDDNKWSLTRDRKDPDKRLMECIRKCQANAKDMKKLIFQLAAKSVRAGSQTPVKQKGSSVKVPQVSATSSVANSGLVGAAVAFDANPPGYVFENNKKQLSIEEFFATDNRIPPTAQESCNEVSVLSVGCANPLEPKRRSLFYLSPVVKSFDEATQMVMRTHGNSKSVNNNYFLLFDNLSGKVVDVMTRFKLLRFLLVSVVNNLEGESLTKAFQEDEVYSLLIVWFGLRTQRRDASNIRPDGYCFYRVLYQLYRQVLSDYTLSVEEMVNNDRLVNNSPISTPENDEFRKFLSTLRDLNRPMRDVEDPLANVDQKAFQEAVDVALYYNLKYPGKGIGHDEWGSDYWFRFVLFNLSQFKVVANDRSTTISRLLYGGVARGGEQWSVLDFTSLCDTDRPRGVTLPILKKALETPNFCSFSNSHFYIIPNPQPEDSLQGVNEILGDIVSRMVKSIQLFDGNHQALLEDVNTILLSLQSDVPCDSVKQFDVEQFRKKMTAANPGSGAMAQPVRNVIDLVNKEPPQLSAEQQKIAILEKKVQELEKRCRSYKKLMEHGENNEMAAQTTHDDDVESVETIEEPLLGEPETVEEPSLAEPETVTRPPPAEPETVEEPPLAEPETVTGPPLSEPETVTGPPLAEPETVEEPPLAEPEIVTGPPLSEPETVEQLPLAEPETVTGPPLSEPETVEELPLAEPETVEQLPLAEPETVEQLPLAEPGVVSKGRKKNVTPKKRQSV